MIAQKVAQLTLELAESEAMGQQQDPLVALKQQELDIKALDLQRKAEQDMMSNEIRENEIDEKLDVEKMKLENNEDQAAERIRIADQKLKQTRDIAEARLQVEKMKRTAEDRRTKEQGKKK
jgi:ribonuclease BN (tRNA processing enzyme)